MEIAVTKPAAARIFPFVLINKMLAMIETARQIKAAAILSGSISDKYLPTVVVTALVFIDKK
jgi:hypothetical protein